MIQILLQYDISSQTEIGRHHRDNSVIEHKIRHAVVMEGDKKAKEKNKTTKPALERFPVPENISKSVFAFHSPGA